MDDTKKSKGQLYYEEFCKRNGWTIKKWWYLDRDIRESWQFEADWSGWKPKEDENGKD